MAKTFRLKYDVQPLRHIYGWWITLDCAGCDFPVITPGTPACILAAASASAFPEVS